jgi:thermostable 8-oxoguanine DNA glycosylase
MNNKKILKLAEQIDKDLSKAYATTFENIKNSYIVEARGKIRALTVLLEDD